MFLCLWTTLRQYSLRNVYLESEPTEKFVFHFCFRHTRLRVWGLGLEELTDSVYGLPALTDTPLCYCLILYSIPVKIWNGYLWSSGASTLAYLSFKAYLSPTFATKYKRMLTHC